MTETSTDASADRYVAALVVRRIIHATPEKLFAAWTEPAHLAQWWGPECVSCPRAEIDLRVGGPYRIANRFPDGTLVWIVGVFEVVESPYRLVYTWRLESQSKEPERVTVCFERRGASTEVIVVHERIDDAATRADHERGWNGCFDGLANYVAHRLDASWN
jgi:uncharacterized protein YndB with AHSA1/START domain